MGRFVGKVAVVGVGHSRVYRRAEVPLGKLAVEAALAAITDAGLKPSDIDGVVTSPAFPAAGGGAIDGIHLVGTDFIVKALRLEPNFLDQGAVMVTQAFHMAVNAVAAGACNYALVFRAMHNPDGRYGRTDPSVARGIDQFEMPYGGNAVATAGMMFRRYMDKYGGRREQLGQFIVNNRAQALKYEHGYWYQNKPEPLTLDDYMTSRPITEPICIHDCDIPVQGAGAFVVTTAERARDLPHRPAHIIGTAVSPRFFEARNSAFAPTLEDNLDIGRVIGRNLLENAGITVGDIDVVNLYDGFAPVVPFWADSLGLCPEGQGLAWVANPDIPLNTSSGNLGGGRMHGVAHLLDGALQVMGRSGQRQVKDAKISVVCVAPADIGGGVVFSSEPN